MEREVPLRSADIFPGILPTARLLWS